ncbi:hypothetical protein [Croceicoccus hydrothermalis]|uniref:hypothetical protein n=1 Tax=Croceicoccus hydrothermalis TaxID=2867964 RepID=UPI001EFB078B|nr:hypothetical protein [Croceicoccus hydrothermalis]
MGFWQIRHILPTISPSSIHKVSGHFDYRCHQERNRIERTFDRPKPSHRIANCHCESAFLRQRGSQASTFG